MVKSTPKTLRGKRKQESVDVITPPGLDLPEGPEIDLESSFLSICYFLQSESEASLRLVTESHMLSKMLDRLTCGTPRDIEELILGALSSSLSWVPSDVVLGLVKQGLLEFCHKMVVRFSEKISQARVQDRAAEISLDILRDILHLEYSARDWILGQASTYVGLAVACPLKFPAVVIKRSSARLIYALVDTIPSAFVPGKTESRLSGEEAQGLFALCKCQDIETCCYVTMAGLILEDRYGSSVVPALSNISFSPVSIARSVVEEACNFTNEPNAEEELRLIQWRSKIRGISDFISTVSDAMDEFLAASIETQDNIEEKKFFALNAKNMQPSVHLQLSDKIQGSDSLLVPLDRFSALLATSRGPVSAEGETEESSSTGIASLYMDDRDVENVFDLIGSIVKIEKYRNLRFVGKMDGSVVVFASRLLHMLVARNADIVAAEAVVIECLDTISSYLLSVVSGKNTQISEVLESGNLSQLVSVVLAKIARESLLAVDNRHIVSDDEEEEASETVCAVLDILQLVFGLGDAAIQSTCAAVVISTLFLLTEQTLTVQISCSLIETMFVVFGDNDHDNILGSIEWVQIVSSIAVFLHSKLAAKKSSRDDRAVYLQGTVDNIKAFVQYKRNQ